MPGPPWCPPTRASFLSPSLSRSQYCWEEAREAHELQKPCIAAVSHTSWRSGEQSPSGSRNALDDEKEKVFDEYFTPDVCLPTDPTAEFFAAGAFFVHLKSLIFRVNTSHLLASTSETNDVLIVCDETDRNTGHALKYKLALGENLCSTIEEWQQCRSAAEGRGMVVVPLLSGAFMHSEVCYVAMVEALEQGWHLVPVLVNALSYRTACKEGDQRSDEDLHSRMSFLKAPHTPHTLGG